MRRIPIKTTRRVPIKIRPEPEEDLSDAVWYEQPLVLDDADYDNFLHSERRKGGSFVCRPLQVPDGFQKRGFVSMQRKSRKPLFIEGSEYVLCGFVEAVVRGAGQSEYTVTLRNPILPLAHPDPDFRVRGRRR